MPTEFIEGLFQRPSADHRHLSAPLSDRRREYLRELLLRGHSQKLVKDRACMLLSVLRLVSALHDEPVSELQIKVAAERWAQEPCNRRRSANAGNFITTARDWFSYLNTYRRNQRLNPVSEAVLLRFEHELRAQAQVRESTIRSTLAPLVCFLEWASRRDKNLADITLIDVDTYLIEGRLGGWQLRTVAAQCRSLRAFFRFAEREGSNARPIGDAITAPRASFRPTSQPCPSWASVRRLIAALDSRDPSQSRAKAVVLLASVYGLRRSEILGLTLDQLDWGQGVITVQRAKHGRLQQFPLRQEVGEALVDYLTKVRPSSTHRQVFLTQTHPVRPAKHLASAVQKVIVATGLMKRPCGLHALRHACATELLRTGTSLSGIADFLGHRSLRSVSIYAKADFESLEEVADFRLTGVM